MTTTSGEQQIWLQLFINNSHTILNFLFPFHWVELLMQASWHTLCRKPYLNLCICTVLGAYSASLATISSKTISLGGIATLQYLHYAKQSNQSGQSMYSMQVPAVVTEITLHFNIHAFVYLLTALAAELLFSAFIKMSIKKNLAFQSQISVIF